MLLYAATIFLSAFLLFQVQPLIAKIILPWFGGSAAVWSAALLFFQVSLLAGYAYAHVSIRRLSARGQMMLHAALLLVSCALLPILPSPKWEPSHAGDPTLRILMLLAATIGLPYFLLSSTSPLLQAWYVRRSRTAMPYRLFALSNFGSMLGLLSFPFLVEPVLTSHQQAYSWSGAYVAFALLCAGAAWVSRQELLEEPAQNEALAEAAARQEATFEAAAAASPGSGTTHAPAIESAAKVSEAAQRPAASELVLWVSLAACASVLLVSITNHLSQNVAPIPLLWVIPLGLYLLSFILCFESDRIYKRWIFLPPMAGLLGWMAYLIYARYGNVHIKWVIPVFALGLFFCCMMCHGELARRKPKAEHLTLFYLMVSLGGAVGGSIVAVLAPHVFHAYLELPIGMAACALLAVLALWNVEIVKLGSWPLRVALCIGLGALGGYLVRHEYDDEMGYRLMDRNFYGVLKVHDDNLQTDMYAERTLTHGTINHGSQLLSPELRYVTTSYYGETSGVGRAIRAVQARGPARIGVVGLGAGVLSNYGRKGDYVRIYEINPLVPQIAQTQFSFYPHSQADKKILLGDARLTLQAQLADGQNQHFDVLAVDAFSSDAIPVHLLTREALALYFKQLKPNGILALHISNRYLNLAPVCAAGARYFGKEARVVSDDPEDVSYLSASTWVLVTAAPEWFKAPEFQDADMEPATVPPHFRAWTDDYSNIVQILQWN